MRSLIKGFWQGLIEEATMKSIYGSDLSADTFFKWVGAVCFFSLGYFLIFNLDAWLVDFSRWSHTTFGWDKSTPPSPAKIAWHRLTGGLLCGGGIFVATLHFVLGLYYRIKARIAVSKAKNESRNSSE
jgi:hypothetical protein